MSKILFEKAAKLTGNHPKTQVGAEALHGEILSDLKRQIRSERDDLPPGVYKQVKLPHYMAGDQLFQARQMRKSDLELFRRQWPEKKTNFITPADEFAKLEAEQAQALFDRTMVLFGERPFPAIQAYVVFEKGLPLENSFISRIENSFWNRIENRHVKGVSTALWWVMLENKVLHFTPGEVLDNVDFVRNEYEERHFMSFQLKMLRRQIFLGRFLSPSSTDVIEALVNLRLTYLLRVGEYDSLDNLARAAGVPVELAGSILQRRIETWKF